MNLTIHIERLILDGFTVPPEGQAHLQAAVEAELGRLLTAGGLAPPLRRGGAVASIAGGRLDPSADDPARLGRRIAQSVAGALGGPEPGSTR